MSEYQFNNIDPGSSFTAEVRTLACPVLTGPVVYDRYLMETGKFKPMNSRWVYVGESGNLSYVKYDGTTETLPNLVSGVWHPIAAIKVNSSGTTITEDMLRWGN